MYIRGFWTGCMLVSICEQTFNGVPSASKHMQNTATNASSFRSALAPEVREQGCQGNEWLKQTLKGDVDLWSDTVHAWVHRKQYNTFRSHACGIADVAVTVDLSTSETYEHSPSLDAHMLLHAPVRIFTCVPVSCFLQRAVRSFTNWFYGTKMKGISFSTWIGISSRYVDEKWCYVLTRELLARYLLIERKPNFAVHAYEHINSCEAYAKLACVKNIGYSPLIRREVAIASDEVSRAVDHLEVAQCARTERQYFLSQLWRCNNAQCSLGRSDRMVVWVIYVWKWSLFPPELHLALSGVSYLSARRRAVDVIKIRIGSRYIPFVRSLCSFARRIRWRSNLALHRENREEYRIDYVHSLSAALDSAQHQVCSLITQ